MTHWLALTVQGSFALAGGCFTWALAGYAADLLEWPLRRMRSKELRIWNRESRNSRSAIRHSPFAIPNSPLVWAIIAIGLAGAVLARDALLSPALAVLGLVGAYVFRSFVRGQHALANAEAVSTLVEMFESMFVVQRSAFGVLEEAVHLLPAGDVRRAVEAATDLHRLNRPLDECWQPLRDLNDPFVNEFMFILERIGLADLVLTTDMLRQLIARLRRRQARANRTRVTMAQLRSTVRVMQGAFAAAVIACLTLGLWRSYWLASVGNRLLYLALVAGGLGMSAYFEQRLQALREELA